MSHFKFFLLILFAFALASCATGPKVDYEGISSSIESGNTGGIMAGFVASGNSTANLILENVATGAKSPVSFTLFPNYPKIHSLEPGIYKIKSGTYKTINGTIPIKHGAYTLKSGPIDKYSETGNLTLIGLWAEEFEVKAGEVANLANVLDRITTLSTKKWEDYNITHLSFRIQPMSESFKKLALKKYPTLKNRVVDRPLKLTLTESEFRSIASKAATRGAGGELPSKSNLRKKLSAGVSMKIDEKKRLKGRTIP